MNKRLFRGLKALEGAALVIKTNAKGGCLIAMTSVMGSPVGEGYMSLRGIISANWG